MAKRRTSQARETKFRHEEEFNLSGYIIKKGDLIKIDGEHGSKFQFHSLVTNLETGVQWVDCYEMEKGLLKGSRSYYPHRVKRIPTRRKRVHGD
jgi:hypothetical protein